MTVMAAGHTTHTVAAAAGITYRQITYWWRQGVHRPALRPSAGSGSPAAWSDEDMLVLAACGRLSRLGADTVVLRRVAAYLTANPGFDGRLFVVAGGHPSQVPPGQDAYWCVDLGAVAADMARRGPW